MIYNFEQLVGHNKAFYNAFVDLKVTGWNTYSTALNAYTFNFFKEQITQMDNAVAKLGDVMKKGAGNDK
jgi:hypothetical protein